MKLHISFLVISVVILLCCTFTVGNVIVERAGSCQLTDTIASCEVCVEPLSNVFDIKNKMDLSRLEIKLSNLIPPNIATFSKTIKLPDFISNFRIFNKLPDSFTFEVDISPALNAFPVTTLNITKGITDAVVDKLMLTDKFLGELCFVVEADLCQKQFSVLAKTSDDLKIFEFNSRTVKAGRECIPNQNFLEISNDDSGNVKICHPFLQLFVDQFICLELKELTFERKGFKVCPVVSYQSSLSNSEPGIEIPCLQVGELSPCSNFRNCESCSGDSSCGWCPFSNSCQKNGEESSCASCPSDLITECNPDEVQESREISSNFTLLDLDSNWKIDRKEWLQLQNVLSVEDSETLFIQYDTDGDNEISFSEYKGKVESRSKIGAGGIAAIFIGVIAFFALGAVFGAFILKKKKPEKFEEYKSKAKFWKK